MNKLECFKTNTRFKLAGLWASLMFLYIYCDIFSIFRPGHLEEIMAGKIGPFDIGQGTLAIFGTLMIPVSLMVAVSLIAKPGFLKWVSIVLGIIYTFVNIGNLVGETWVYYWEYGILELAITIFIIIVAIKWPKEENKNA